MGGDVDSAMLEFFWTYPSGNHVPRSRRDADSSAGVSVCDAARCDFHLERGLCVLAEIVGKSPNVIVRQVFAFAFDPLNRDRLNIAQEPFIEVKPL